MSTTYKVWIDKGEPYAIDTIEHEGKLFWFDECDGWENRVVRLDDDDTPVLPTDPNHARIVKSFEAWREKQATKGTGPGFDSRPDSQGSGSSTAEQYNPEGRGSSPRAPQGDGVAEAHGAILSQAVPTPAAEPDAGVRVWINGEGRVWIIGRTLKGEYWLDGRYVETSEHSSGYLAAFCTELHGPEKAAMLAKCPLPGELKPTRQYPNQCGDCGRMSMQYIKTELHNGVMQELAKCPVCGQEEMGEVLTPQEQAEAADSSPKVKDAYADGLVELLADIVDEFYEVYRFTGVKWVLAATRNAWEEADRFAVTGRKTIVKVSRKSSRKVVTSGDDITASVPASASAATRLAEKVLSDCDVPIYALDLAREALAEDAQREKDRLDLVAERDDHKSAITLQGFLIDKVRKERDELRAKLAAMETPCNGNCQIALARRQVGADGVVPGNARECAELWEREASLQRGRAITAEAKLEEAKSRLLARLSGLDSTEQSRQVTATTMASLHASPEELAKSSLVAPSGARLAAQQIEDSDGVTQKETPKIVRLTTPDNEDRLRVFTLETTEGIFHKVGNNPWTGPSFYAHYHTECDYAHHNHASIVADFHRWYAKQKAVNVSPSVTHKETVDRPASKEELAALRDSFAIASLSGIQANTSNNTRNIMEDAKLAYETADRMLLVRNGSVPLKQSRTTPPAPSHPRGVYGKDWVMTRANDPTFEGVVWIEAERGLAWDKNTGWSFSSAANKDSGWRCSGGEATLTESEALAFLAEHPFAEGGAK